MAGWSWRCAGRLHQQVFITTTAPPCFITPTDCAKLLPDIFQTDPLSTNAQHDRCLIWWMYLKGMFCDTSLMSNSGRCYKYITIPGITLNQWHMSRMFIIKDTFTQKFIHSASCGSEVRWSFEINLGAFILCFVCFIYFFFFKNKSSSSSVVSENATTCFCCAAPENILWTLKLSFWGYLLRTNILCLPKLSSLSVMCPEIFKAL